MINPTQKYREAIRKRFHANGWHGFEKHIAAAADECAKIAMDKRTVQQNAYLFGVPYKLISEYTGYGVSECHYEMRMLFHFEFKERFDGSMVKTPKTTTSMSKKEFSEYWEKIQIFAAQEWDLYIPDPSEELMISKELETERQNS